MRRLPLLVVAILVLALAGWWLSRPKPLPVTLHTVASGPVQAIVSNTRAGSVESCQRAKMSPIAGGRIEAIPVKEGDRVRKGDVLIRLWNEDQQADQAVAEAQVRSAERRGQEACTVAANAQREAERVEALQGKGFVSLSKVDQARSEANARAATCAAAQADVTQTQARVKLSRTVQQRTVMLAPFDGTVAKITGELGELAIPSPPGVPTPPAIDLIDDSCLYITAPMDEVDAPRIRPGQSVSISFDALPGQRFPGKVSRIAPYVVAVEKQARTVDVDVAFDDPAQARGLLVGYSADVEILLEQRESVLRIPTPALRDGNKVLRYRSGDHTLEEVRVTPGLANWEYTEVRSGLASGERIVTRFDNEAIRAGARVTPIEPPAP